MIETYIEYTCDGCGAADNHLSPDVSRKDFRAYMRKTYGWRSVGRLDYCKSCVAKGYTKTLRCDFNG